MGTWHIDKDRLKQILTKPIKNKDGTDKLGDGLGDDSFYDFLYELNKKHATDKIINAEVIDWLATPDREKLVWLQPSDVNDIKNNTVTYKYGKPTTSPSLLENIENAIEDKILPQIGAISGDKNE
tara:strand:+ start:596 stop:970 length:375 start_codon:yes stop_codon:yes gene_type:complete